MTDSSSAAIEIIILAAEFLWVARVVIRDDHFGEAKKVFSQDETYDDEEQVRTMIFLLMSRSCKKDEILADENNNQTCCSML